MYLSVVLPSYNELRNIEAGVLPVVYDYLSKQEYDWELLLSDDGSTDGTLEQLQLFARNRKGVKVLNNPHRGKGPTVISALVQSKGEWALFSDFDQATPIGEIEKLLPYTQKGYEVVIGSREGKGSERKKEPFYRHIMGRAFNLFVRSIAIGGFQDTQCGFKLFSHTAIQELCPKVYVYGGGTRKDAFTGAFDVELLYLAQKYKYKTAEVPVFWKHVKTDRVNPLKDSALMFVDLFRIRMADMMGKYK